MSSYMDQPYLGESMLLAQMDMPQASPPAGMGDDLVALPGGIVLPRRTLWLLAAAIAVAALVWWKSRP